MRNILVIAVVIAAIGTGAFFVYKTRTNSSTSDINSQQNNSVGSMEAAPSGGEVKIAREVTVEASEFKFTPSEVRVKKGETVRITLKNSGKMPHNWTVEKMGGATIDTVNGGQSASITVTPSQSGVFTTFCSIGNHRALGMVGTLVVE